LCVFVDFCLVFLYNQVMKDIREIVCTNLVKIRKQHNLTQMELSSKINYSDNAISRWEKGDVLPSLEILQTLASFYGVDLAFFIEEHTDEQTKLLNSKKRVLYWGIISCAVLAVWTICALIFLLLYNYKGDYYYMAFVWGVPSSAFVIRSIVKYSFKNKLSLLTNSICVWTTLAAIYFQWLELNLWQVFLIGMPIQFMLILITVSKGLKISNIKQLKNKLKNSK